MKCYCIEFDLNKRSSKTVYVSKNSTFQIGIKCYKDGELLNSYELHDQSGTPLMPSSSKLADYTTWTLTSGDKEDSQQYQYIAVYTIKLPNGFTKNKKVKLPPLTIITTSSDVAELPGGGNADLTDYYTKEEVDAKVNGVSEKVTALENAGYQTADQVQQGIEAALTGYSTTEEVNTLISEATAPLAPSSSLTAYWKKDETEEHQLTGTYEDGTEFSFTAICKKA